VEVITGLGLGVVFAAQIGPVTLLIVRSVLRGGRAVLVGLCMAVAVAAVDLVYAVVGLAGAGRVLEGDRLRLLVGLAGAAVLVAVGARTLWIGIRARLGLELEGEVATPGSAFLTALAATALNPLTIALWTLSFPAAAPSLEGRGDGLALLVGLAAGTLAWYGGFALAVAAARHRVGPRLLSAVDVGIGGGLVAFGGLLGYRALRENE
jgi:threonine/homoserine/homoserine lactone efflux protein